MGEISVIVPRLRLIKGRYFWRPTKAVKKLGYHNEALGEDQDAAIKRARELNDQVGISRKQNGADSKVIEPESMAALIRHYRQSPKWAKLAPKTRTGYDGILKEIERKTGQTKVRAINRKDLARIYDKLQARGLATSAAHMRVWRIILGHAYDIGWRNDNPAKGLRIVTPPSRETVWGTEQVRTFCKTAIDNQRASLGLALRLALDIGQRPGDILKLSWGEWTGQAFVIKQGKTSKEVAVPVSDLLLVSELNSMTKDSTFVLVSEATKRPWRSSYFSHECTRIRRLAGLPEGLWFMDSRRTSATELGGSGATDDEIRAVTGHQSRGVVAVYVRPDSRMAGNAQDKRRKGREGDR